jgi:HEPN domain-containing protein
MLVDGMGRIEEMLVGASKDFALAERYKQAGEFTISVQLYMEAMEKIFSALFIRKTGNRPPSGASIDYLSMRLKMPKEIFDESTLHRVDKDDEPEAEAYAEAGKGAEERALFMDGVVKRLLDYGMAYERA